MNHLDAIKQILSESNIIFEEADCNGHTEIVVNHGGNADTHLILNFDVNQQLFSIDSDCL